MPDVKSNSDFIVCFVSTESELVVPIRKNGKVIGEIDIDSDTKNAFDRSDEQFISVIAEIIASKKF
ncbi:MAG: GAF domain-containing protein [Thermoplasmata archaeon]